METVLENSRDIGGAVFFINLDNFKRYNDTFGHMEMCIRDSLFTLRNMNDMEEGKDYKDYLDPQSLVDVYKRQVL